MGVHKVTFDYIDNDYINGYNVSAKYEGSEIVKEYVNFDDSVIVKAIESFAYGNENQISLKNKVFTDSSYPIEVYVNNSLIDDNLYFISDRNIQFSYKLNLNINDSIVVKYYRNLYEVEVDIEDNINIENVDFCVLIDFIKTHFNGEHSVFY